MKDWISNLLGNSTNIYSVWTPFYYTLKIFGLAPYKLNPQTKKLQTSCCEYFYIIFFLCSYFSVVLYALYRIKFLDSYLLIDAGIFYQFIYQFLMICVIVFWNFLKRNHILNFLQKIAEFDKIASELKWKYKFSQSQCKLILVCLITASTVILLFIFYLAFITVGKGSIPNCLSFGVAFFVSKAVTLTIFQFTFCAYCIQARFEILNKNAR